MKLLEIRNPWSKTEWKGDWSDHSDKWTVELAEKAGLTQEEDGKFFISVDDFSHYFTTLTICQVHTDYYFDSISF